MHRGSLPEPPPPEVQAAIDRFSPRTVSDAAAAFAREVTAQAKPESPNRAKAYLFAASRLGAFCESIGLELVPTVALQASLVERFVLVGCAARSAATRRTVRSNLRAIALVCLSGGAGLVGADLKALRGTDVVARSGGVVVCVRAGPRPRVVPVLWRYHDRLSLAAGFDGDRLVIGGHHLGATT